MGTLNYSKVNLQFEKNRVNKLYSLPSVFLKNQIAQM